MRNDDVKYWQMNIDDAAERAYESYGSEAVEGVFWRYGARDFYELDPCDYAEVFSELELIAND